MFRMTATKTLKFPYHWPFVMWINWCIKILELLADCLANRAVHWNWPLCNPDNKVNGANMGPTWVLSAPDGHHVGPMNLAIRKDHYYHHIILVRFVIHYPNQTQNMSLTIHDPITPSQFTLSKQVLSLQPPPLTLIYLLFGCQTPDIAHHQDDLTYPFTCVVSQQSK